MCVCVAQQEAQRAQFIVEKAEQERQEKVVQAEGEAQAAKMISFMLFLLKYYSVWSWVFHTIPPKILQCVVMGLSYYSS